jgi:hypothetical protein
MLLLHAARGIQVAFGPFAGNRTFRVTHSVPSCVTRAACCKLHADGCMRHVARCMLTVACGMLHVAGLLRGSQNCMAGSRRGSARASLGERRKGALRTLISTAVAATLASLGERVGFPGRGLIAHAHGMRVVCCTLQSPRHEACCMLHTVLRPFGVLVMPSRRMRRTASRMLDAVGCMPRRVSGSHVFARFFTFAANV